MDDGQEARREADRIRLTIVEGQLHVFGTWAEFTELMLQSKDRHAAIRRLQEPPFTFSELVASYLVDIPVYRSTEVARRALEDEATQLRQRISGT